MKRFALTLLAATAFAVALASSPRPAEADVGSCYSPRPICIGTQPVCLCSYTQQCFWSCQ